MKESHPAIFAACQPLFDRHLSTTWSDSKRNGVQHTTFMRLCMHLLELICEKSDLKLVMDNASDLAPVKEAVCRLCNESVVGATLLAEKRSTLEAQSYSKSCELIMMEMAKKGKITGAEIKATLGKCRNHAKAIGPKAAEMKDRVITLHFLNSVLNLHVVDLNQAALFRCMAVVKECAWGTSSGLPPLSYECWLMEDQGDAVNPGAAAEDVLSEAVQSRTLASDLIASSDISCFGELQVVLARKSDVLCSLDCMQFRPRAVLVAVSDHFS